MLGTARLGLCRRLPRNCLLSETQGLLGVLHTEILHLLQPQCTPEVNKYNRARALATTSMASSKLRMADRLTGLDKSVWVEYGKLAVEHKALNLGQGFPDFFPPSYVQDALIASAKSESPFMHQYTRSYGHPRLVNALAKVFSHVMGRDIDAMEEILVTCGAYQSLFCTVQGLINPGDEVIIIEPFFDCYEPMVRAAGGVPVFVPLRPTKQGEVTSSGDWKLDPQEFASKFNSKTKAIFFNNPNNPVGKVYTMEETEMIADLCKKHDVLVIADEVYEWMIFTGYKHIKIACLPGMWDRTITIGSAGKTFSVTGWKIGWSIAPKHLLHGLKTLHQNSNYTLATPIQEAVATAFELEFARFGKPECYFQSLAAELQPKREKMAKFLHEVGMEPIVPEGGYFMVADFSKLGVKLDEGGDDTRDAKFVKWMTKNKKLAAIPPSVFYGPDNKHLAENLIRFCFIKEDSSLDKAEQIMKEWKATL